MYDHHDAKCHSLCQLHQEMTRQQLAVNLPYHRIEGTDGNRPVCPKNKELFMSACYAVQGGSNF